MKTLSQTEKQEQSFWIMTMTIPGGSLKPAFQGASMYAILLLTGVIRTSGNISGLKKSPWTRFMKWDFTGWAVLAALWRENSGIGSFRYFPLMNGHTGTLLTKMLDLKKKGREAVWFQDLGKCRCFFPLVDVRPWYPRTVWIVLSWRYQWDLLWLFVVEGRRNYRKISIIFWAAVWSLDAGNPYSGLAGVFF
mgnify:CR=1 FL=1